jgi:hypothetical protein
MPALWQWMATAQLVQWPLWQARIYTGSCGALAHGFLGETRHRSAAVFARASIAVLLLLPLHDGVGGNDGAEEIDPTLVHPPPTTAYLGRFFSVARKQKEGGGCAFGGLALTRGNG